ncbi:serine/threonine protein kinase [bacterium]|nr:serine/threonine protein kinase [Gemmataceae bacterium]NBS88934.1 serine/threonine protein kinase [bacterium]NBT62554.1 serine/threonine protein kinase [Planctomycetia bacterium]
MSDQITKCPEQEELRKCVFNQMPANELDAIKAHVKMCPKCRVSFTTILKEKVAKENQGIGPIPPATKTAPDSPSKPAETPSQKGDDSHSTQQKVITPVFKPAYPFLDPPTKAGGLGCLGDYELIRVLGEGGMGIVFEADDKKLGRKVALKVLRPELTDENFRQRFEREGKISSSIQDDNICLVYQAGVHKLVSFMAMEFLKGEDLDEKLKRDGWLPIPVVFKIAKQMALGLAAAHEKKLIHRDIKPANVWLESSGPGGDFKRVKLLDFGLAKSTEVESTLTAKGMIVGTPNYMAPEQICGEPLDERADLFSLGCVMYRMLSGKIPFEKENTLAVLHAVVESEIPSLNDLDQKLPKEVYGLMTKLLSKDPADRPATARKVVAMIEAIENSGLEGEKNKVLSSMLFKAPDIQRQKKTKIPLGAIVGAGVILVAVVIGIILLVFKFFDGVKN